MRDCSVSPAAWPGSSNTTLPMPSTGLPASSSSSKRSRTSPPTNRRSRPGALLATGEEVGRRGGRRGGLEEQEPAVTRDAQQRRGAGDRQRLRRAQQEVRGRVGAPLQVGRRGPLQERDGAHEYPRDAGAEERLARQH